MGPYFFTISEFDVYHLHALLGNNFLLLLTY